MPQGVLNACEELVGEMVREIFRMRGNEQIDQADGIYPSVFFRLINIKYNMFVTIFFLPQDFS